MHLPHRTLFTHSALKSNMNKVWVSAEGAHLSRLHWLPGLLDYSGLLVGYWLALQALPQQVVPAARLVPSPQAASSLVRAVQGCLKPEHMLSVSAIGTLTTRESLQQQLDARIQKVWCAPILPHRPEVFRDPVCYAEKLDAESQSARHMGEK